MKRKLFFNSLMPIILTFSLCALYAQSDDDLFGGSEDDLFLDDGIEEWQETESNDTASTNLAQGILFQNGSVKIGGSFDTSLTSYTILYQDSDDSLLDNIYNTRLQPKASAELTIDARPKQVLRMYTKCGLAYPYSISASSYATTTLLESVAYTDVTTSISNSFYVKELFTDFSLLDRAYFRFGLHTVTWGTGYFFSPVSNIINTSAIDPEDTDEQVNGSLNLRTQIIFPGSQNCLWFYLIPDATVNQPSATALVSGAIPLSSYLESLQYSYDARKTALAAKGDFVIKNWELGAGAYFKFQNAPKAMLTASGSIINGKVNVFGEGVYNYGSAREWNSSPNDWRNKTSIFQATIGASYYWKVPEITFAAQYYYDGNSDDNAYITSGHNIAASVIFGRIFGTQDITATLFGLFYIGKDSVESALKAYSLYQDGIGFNPYSAIVSATMSWSPISELKLSAGPYLTWTDFSDMPTVALKLSASLGGGSF